MNNLPTFLVAFLLITPASAVIVHPIDLPNKTDIMTMVYSDDDVHVLTFKATEKIDQQGIHSIIVAQVYNPQEVDKVVADIGRVEFDCRNHTWQVMTDFELDLKGDVIDERVQSENTGYQVIKPGTVIGMVSQIVCGTK
ncbi:MAG: hypothetical protein ACREQ5_40780 [Candidatus Dormibacteria bacterium]